MAMSGDMPADSRSRVRRLIGVYNANGTLRGELTYWIGAKLGRAHCALCDITHGGIRERPEWASCRARLRVAFDTFHLDDQPSDVRQFLHGAAPAVVADTDAGLVLLLGADELAACDGSPEGLAAAIESAAGHHGLAWT